MTYIVALARGALPLLALVLALGACDGADPTEPLSTTDVVTAPPGPSFASSFRGGIPIGATGQPTSAFGDRLNGALRNIWPKLLLGELAAIKAKGGKVVLMFAGNERHYKGRDGHFDLGMWKARIDRFKGVNFSSYINDGTIVGHYLIDEPNDANNWHGKPIAPATVEEMAKYSKQLWPNMVTIVRTEPAYLNQWSGKYQHLDAAWAQYVARKGDVGSFINRNVSDAQKKGLGLVVGLNISKGSLTKSQLSATQIKTWGSVLLSSSYPCAFISWKYDAKYLQRSDIQQAMAALADAARKRATKTCRGTNGQTSGTAPEPRDPPSPPEPTDPPEPAEPPEPPAPREPPAPVTAPSVIQLAATGWASANGHHVRLTWSGAKGSRVDVYRDGVRIRRTPNDGHNISGRKFRGSATYAFKVCEAGTSNCSNSATFKFK
ncbi:MAG: hypothetical protein ACREMZ_01920 [Gemmatimonadales bacterium]